MNVVSSLRYQELGVDASNELIVYLSRANQLYKDQGMRASSRIEVRHQGRTVNATLHLLSDDFLDSRAVGLSSSAARQLGAVSGDLLQIHVAQSPTSFRFVREKIHGYSLDRSAFDAILADVLTGQYSVSQTTAFLVTLASQLANKEEVAALTGAMVACGERLQWNRKLVADKHCIGGLPGNRTTPIVVAIVSACGVFMPKTSSRAITSPAGTADTMEVITPVNLSMTQMRKTVEKVGGCFVWGGAFDLSPADAALIEVARPLELDSDAQLVSSILSKKIAAGASHVIIDIPVGPTAKVRTEEHLQRLRSLLQFVANAHGIKLHIVQTDGTAPIGRGFGPALEARDVLQVLQQHADAPQDLRQRALYLAAELLEFCEVAEAGHGLKRATEVLDSGLAFAQFKAICMAQGGYQVPPKAPIEYLVRAQNSGHVASIHNRHLSRLAFTLGAPSQATSGVELLCKQHSNVQAGDVLMALHAQTHNDLEVALAYLQSNPVIDIQKSCVA